MAATNGDRSGWENLIRAEYLEIPGLSLTAPQAQRMWGLDPDICRTLLDEMVQEKFLRRTHQNCYVRFD
jgi:hypothetical protein